MPRVNEEYINQKRTSIIEATIAVYETKPLYQITMRDIIKQLGVSQGGIYRYFSDVDEILVEMINRCNPSGDYKGMIDEIIKNSKSSKQAVEELFEFLGNYMQENSGILGKILFELTVIMSIQPDRGRKIQSKIKDGQSGQYFIQQLNKVIRNGVAAGFFYPVIQLEQILSFISIAIDGIIMDGCLLQCYGVPQIGEIPFDIIKTVNTLKTSVLLLLCPEPENTRRKYES
jgi:AcrR family transcriptional regulator